MRARRRCQYLGWPLPWASISYFVKERLHVLTDHGVDINITGGYYGCALQAAAGGYYHAALPAAS